MTGIDDLVSLRIEVNDAVWGTMHFDALAAGPADGDLVLLLHGFPQTSWSWHTQLAALGAAGYRAVAPDQRGYSPGARPRDVDAYGSNELVGDVVGIASALGAERFHLVGHDWGGAIAWQVAGRHPERVRTLTVLSTPHPRAFAVSLGLDPDVTEGHHGVDGAPSDRSSDQASRSSYIDYFRAEGSELGLLANDAAGLRLVLCGTGLSEEQAAPYLAALGTPEALGAALNWYRAATLASAANMGTITMPTAYLWGTEDPALGRDAAEATAACVDGPYRFEILDGIGHWIAEEIPERTTAVLLDQLALA